MNKKRMNRKAQFDLSEISPIAAGMGLVAAIVGYFVSARMDTGVFWTILSTLVSGVVGFLVANKMADG